MNKLQQLYNSEISARVETVFDAGFNFSLVDSMGHLLAPVIYRDTYDQGIEKLWEVAKKHFPKAECFSTKIQYKEIPVDDFVGSEQFKVGDLVLVYGCYVGGPRKGIIKDADGDKFHVEMKSALLGKTTILLDWQACRKLQECKNG